MPAPKGNQFAVGQGGGRPPRFESVEDLDKQIQEYFDSCEYKETPSENPDEPPAIQYGDTITITGLAYFLGFESRQSFYDYEGKKEFSYSIKRARLAIESNYEKKLSASSPAGAIFALKNFGWKDTQEIKHDIPKGIFNIDPLADDPTDDSTAEDSQS